MPVDVLDSPIDFILNIRDVDDTALILDLQDEGHHRQDVKDFKLPVHAFSIRKPMFATSPGPASRTAVILSALSQQQP